MWNCNYYNMKGYINLFVTITSCDSVSTVHKGIYENANAMLNKSEET